MTRKHHIASGLLITLLLFSVIKESRGQAQQKPHPPQKALTQYVHQVWQADDGLPQNTVGAVMQT